MTFFYKSKTLKNILREKKYKIASNGNRTHIICVENRKFTFNLYSRIKPLIYYISQRIQLNWLEHWLVTPKVAGSSPVVLGKNFQLYHSIYYKNKKFRYVVEFIFQRITKLPLDFLSTNLVCFLPTNFVTTGKWFLQKFRNK